MIAIWIFYICAALCGGLCLIWGVAEIFGVFEYDPKPKTPGPVCRKGVGPCRWEPDEIEALGTAGGFPRFNVKLRCPECGMTDWRCFKTIGELQRMNPRVDAGVLTGLWKGARLIAKRDPYDREPDYFYWHLKG